MNQPIISDQRLGEMFEEWYPECHLPAGEATRASFLAGARAVLKELGYRPVHKAMVTLDVPLEGVKHGVIYLGVDE